MKIAAMSRLMALLILSLSFAGAAQAAEADGRFDLEACNEADIPREAFRYGLAGTVRLGFDLSPAGVVESVTMLKGTGWNALDAAAIAALAKCQFPADPANAKKKFAVNYLFRPSQLNPGVTFPVVRQDTCPASEIFTSLMSPRDENISNADGVLLRFDVDEVGRAHGVQFEERAWDPRILAAATDYVQACRFNPSKRAGIKSRASTSGRLLIKPAAGK